MRGEMETGQRQGSYFLILLGLALSSFLQNGLFSNPVTALLLHRWASSGISMTGRPESSEGPEALGCARNEPPAWSSSPRAVLCTTRKVLEGDLRMCVLPNVVPYKPNADSIHPFENQFQNCRHKMHFPM